MSNWKKTKEELPEDGQEVIFRNIDNFQAYGYYCKTLHCFYAYEGDNDAWEGNVIGWFPIPKFDL